MYRKKFIDRLRKKYQSGGAPSYYEENNESYMQTGGVKDMLKFGLKGAKPFLKGAAKRLSGPLGLVLGSQTAYAEPVIDESGVNRFTGKKEFTSFGQGPPTSWGDTNVNVKNVNKDLAAAMAPRMQLGGMRLPGGIVKPIPGSDAVEFKGATHNQGGIMLDQQTEVENGETMDQVSMAKKGGKRDYFFSSYLKEGGRSYADMHKDILRSGGNQEEINMLARMQEKAAGRNPNKVAKLGGVIKYQTGGELKSLEDKYSKHEANKPTFDLKAPKKPRRLKANANAVEKKMYEAKMEKYQAQLDEYNAAKTEYDAALSEWEATESELSDTIEQEQLLVDAEEREAEKKAAERKAKNDKLVARGKELNIPIAEMKTMTLNELENAIKQEELKAQTDLKQDPEREGTTPGQTEEKIGGYDYFLSKDKDGNPSDTAKLIETLGDDFPEFWMNKVDQEVLDAAGITEFDDMFNDDGSQNYDAIIAYQRAYNAKYGKNSIGEDGVFGNDTTETAIEKDTTISEVLDEVVVEENRTVEKVPRIPMQNTVLPSENEGELIQAAGPAPEGGGGDRFIDASKDLLDLDIQSVEDYEKAEKLLEYNDDTDQWERKDQDLISLKPKEMEQLPVDTDEPELQTVDMPEYTPSEVTVEELEEEDDDKYKTARVPWQAYGGMIAGLGAGLYSYFHKQPPAEQAGYTPGFTRPVVAERGVAPRLERYDYNQDIANVGAEVRGMNKYIETSGGGPANMINKMMAFSQGQDAKMKIRAAETRANIGVQNTEAQLEQQMTLDNMRRSQAASIFNSQMIRAESARKDQVDEMNTRRRQKRKDDMEYQKYAGISSLASSLQTGFGDILDYKADIAMAEAVGSGTGVYNRSTMPFIEGLTWDEESQSFKIKT